MPLSAQPELQDEKGVEPDRPWDKAVHLLTKPTSNCASHGPLRRGLKDLAGTMGIHLVDHEVVTLLRHFGVAGEGGQPPRIVGPLALRAAQ